MAKRRKLEAPSAADLDKLEQEFRRETPGGPGLAPIAQVASESAMNMDVVSTEQRKDTAELDRFRAAEERGLVGRSIPIEEIDVSAITRDRLRLDAEAFNELKGSILKNGLRMPIEVFEQDPGADKRYGLISGFRRLRAVQEIQMGPGDHDGMIDAFVRPRRDDAALTEAMIEENEIRAALSHYERARISVLSVQNGYDASLEAAVNRLFGFASKAKRSKIRSFATIYEALGDVLRFGDGLKEKQGLLLATAVREGAANPLREALAQTKTFNADEEWKVISRVLTPKDPPQKSKSVAKQFRTDGGVSVAMERDPKSISFLIGDGLTDAQTTDLIAFIKKLV